MGIRIIADSTTEITQKEAAELNITIVPLKSIFGDKEYLEGVDLTPEQFYEKLAESKELPKTSQPSPAEFEKAYKEAQANGDKIITICLASSISGTYQSANIAKETCGGDIWVIDSGNTTVGEQLLVRLAIQMRDAGKSAEEIVKTLEEKKDTVRLFAVVDTLEYLHKGGRMSKATAIAGTLLKIKPLIAMQENELKLIGKSRGLKNAYKEVFKFVDSEGGIDYSMPFAIGYTGDIESFKQFESDAKERFDGHEPIVSIVGSVIGTHVGPGAVAVTFFKRT